MIYLTIEILIVAASIGIAIISCGRAAYWRHIAKWNAKRADIFYYQYVELVKSLDNEWSENE